VRLEAKRFYGDAWPKWWPNFGPGIAAGFLGARVYATADTTWFESPDRVLIADLDLAFDVGNVWWQRVQALTRRAVERWGSSVAVGHTDLGGNLDILASLLTSERLLYDLHDNPGEVARLASRLTRLWLRYYDQLHALVAPAGRGTTPWAAIWSPGRCYMLQSDFAYMISPRMFERFVLPDLAACCEELDHAFYHLDGDGQIRHLDMLLSLERLRGIQWIPGEGQPPPEEWLSLLQRIRDAGKLCQLYVSPEGARTIVRELGGRGFAFYILQTLSRTEAESFLREIQREE
jgi:5-methyltetrahydrofolate--homocysteine methyltransferase